MSTASVRRPPPPTSNTTTRPYATAARLLSPCRSPRPCWPADRIEPARLSPLRPAPPRPDTRRSIGVLAYMLCSGRAPFKGRSDDEIVASVRRGKYTLSSRYWDGLSELAKNFVRQCLQYYPSRRPSAATLLTDPWMLAVRKAGFGPDGVPRPLHSDVLANLRDFSQFNPIKVRSSS